MWFPLHEVPGVVRSLETEYRQWGPGAGEGHAESEFNGDRVSPEETTESGGGSEGRTAMGMCLKPRNCVRERG